MRRRVTASQTSRFPFIYLKKFSPLLDIRHKTTHIHRGRLAFHPDYLLQKSIEMPRSIPRGSAYRPAAARPIAMLHTST
ncbi:hypothetical protein TNCV_5136901 [Trichonephila clavipes]|nr:hypothetical protein TNCV_5136901 [Trichonephila clavipes]